MNLIMIRMENSTELKFCPGLCPVMSKQNTLGSYINLCNGRNNFRRQYLFITTKVIPVLQENCKRQRHMELMYLFNSTS
jgi:hypothetical protein